MKIRHFVLTAFILFSSFSITGCGNNDTGSPIIISEVVEGSGNNKAIELYNLTNKSINLSSYKIILSFNEGYYIYGLFLFPK
jgi:predicted extracellular nuclease